MPRELPTTITLGEPPEEIVVEVPYTYIAPARAPHVKLDPAAEMGLRLFAAGYRLSEAARIASTKPARIRKLLATDYGKETLQHIRLELDEEFKNLYGDAIKTLREGMGSGDLKVRLDAADKYLKYSRDLKVNLVLSAEDLIKAIRDGRAE